MRRFAPFIFAFLRVILIVSFVLLVLLAIMDVYQIKSFFEEEAGSDFVTYIYEKLTDRFYDPSKLDKRKLFNAGLDGVAELLETKDLEFVPEKIPNDADPASAKAHFKREFERAQKLVKEKQITLAKSQLAFAAAEALLEAVGDSHTRFITAEDWAEERKMERGQSGYAGINVTVAKLEDGYFYIKDIFANGPASMAGLRRFDRIVMVDGQEAGNDIGKLIDRIRGPPASIVVILVERYGQKLEFKVKRAHIFVPVLESRVEEFDGRKISILTLRGFELSITNHARHLGEAIIAEDRDGVIIDLRGNPGGLLLVLDYMVNLFLEENLHIYTLKDQDQELVYRTEKPQASKLPMVVLIDEGSASASEIFSAILQEQGRATIVGEKSAGAVSVGRRMYLAHGAGMMVTVQQFFTAKGKPLEKNGVIPDERLELTREDIKRGRDAQMEKALEVLKKKIESRP